MAALSLNGGPSGNHPKGGLAVRNLTRGPTPRLPFARALGTVLPGWDISLVFVGESRAQALNKKLRGKSYIPNVLSYETGPAIRKRRETSALAVPDEALAKSGEVIICLATLERDAPSHDLSPRTFCLLLFIHGLLHLKGERHSVTMERRERALAARLSLASRPKSPSSPHGQTNRHRHRHRHVPGKAGRGRRSR